jgi:hypothetical protein
MGNQYMGVPYMVFPIGKRIGGEMDYIIMVCVWVDGRYELRMTRYYGDQSSLSLNSASL